MLKKSVLCANQRRKKKICRASTSTPLSITISQRTFNSIESLPRTADRGSTGDLALDTINETEEPESSYEIYDLPSKPIKKLKKKASAQTSKPLKFQSDTTVLPKIAVLKGE